MPTAIKVIDATLICAATGLFFYGAEATAVFILAMGMILKW